MGSRGPHGWSRRLAAIDLVVLLLAVLLVELALNRLAVPVLRPPDAEAPRWHSQLDALALFVFYLGSLLALGTALYQVWELARPRSLFPIGLRRVIAALLLGFALTAGLSIFREPTEDVTFVLETSLAATLLALTIASAISPGDARARLGLGIMVLPFFVHYYGTFTLRVLTDPGMTAASTLPLTVRQMGHYVLLGCAMASPLFFAALPRVRPVTRPAPLFIAVFVGMVGFLILRKHYEVGMELASRGLGVELGPAAPRALVLAYVIAAALVAWTLTATLTSSHPARRRVGVGLGLLVIAGHGYQWPMQLLAVAIGAIAIAEGAVALAREPEPTHGKERAFRAPPMSDRAWSEYLASVAAALAATEDSPDQLRGQRDGVPFEVDFQREAGSLVRVRVTLGNPPGGGPPGWTLSSRPERVLAVGHHPSPPPFDGHVVRTGDAPFDERFRLHESTALSGRLLDEGLRARATAVLDGWVAVWPDRGLVYEVWPGRGAPLDLPVPITELAFRGGAAPGAAEKLTRVIDLLAAIARRAGV